MESTGNALWVSPLTFLEASTPDAGPKPGGQALRLGDVANVVEDHQPLIGDAVLGDARGLLLVAQEWTPLEPGVAEENLYAKGISLVLETTSPGGSDCNELVSYQPGPKPG